MFFWKCGMQVWYPAKLLSIKIHFFSLNFDSNVHKSTIFSKLLFAKSSLEHSERIFKNTLGNLPWQIRPIFWRKLRKNYQFTIHTFFKNYLPICSSENHFWHYLVSLKIKLTVLRVGLLAPEKHVFLANVFNFDFLILFLTNCWRKKCSVVLTFM